MKKLANDIHIGRYQLGWFNVDLFVMPYEDGGWFNVNCDGKSNPQMHIGLLYEHPAEMYSTLTHEAFEFAANELFCVYNLRNGFESSASDTPVFMFNHNQFTEIASRAGIFIHNAGPELLKWWTKAHKARNRARA